MTAERPAPVAGIPEATVARLPVYLRALTASPSAGSPRSPPRSSPPPPGSTPPSCARTSPTSVPTASAASATTSSYLVYQISRELGLTQDWPRRHRRHRQSRPRPGGLRRLRLPRFPGRGAVRRRPGRSASCRRPAGPAHRRPRGGHAPSEASPSASSPPRPVRPAGLRPAGRRRGHLVLNFAPCVLTVPDGVDVRKVDLSIELQILAFHEQRKAAGGRATGGEPCRPPTLAGPRGGAAVSLLVVGLSHRTAPVSAAGARRPRRRRRPRAAADLVAADTCRGRWCWPPATGSSCTPTWTSSTAAVADLRAARPAQRGRRSTSSPPSVRALRGPRRPPPLLRACGLDSMVVGEGQILGQLRDALAPAQERAPPDAC